MAILVNKGLHPMLTELLLQDYQHALETAVRECREEVPNMRHLLEQVPRLKARQKDEPIMTIACLPDEKDETCQQALVQLRMQMRDALYLEEGEYQKERVRLQEALALYEAKVMPVKNTQAAASAASQWPISAARFFGSTLPALGQQLGTQVSNRFGWRM